MDTIEMDQEQQTTTSWSSLEKLFFRFFFCYFLLYVLPFPLNRVPLGINLDGLFSRFYEWLVPLVGQQFFGITRELPLPGGSGDTTFSYLQVLVQLILAGGLTLGWTLLAKKRKDQQNLFNFLLVILRYYVGFMMLSYGMSKIFVNQFPGLSLFDLIKPYGASSPMGLMWNFMEYSGSYSIFSGLAEFIGGILLLFRRTSKLGALIIFAVMLNVFMLNMSYDIPVKLFSFHLMLMSLFILIPHFRSLLNFFIANKPTLPKKYAPYFSSRKWNIAGYVVKGVFVLHALIVVTSNGYSSRQSYGAEAPLPPLYGIYEVQDFIVNNDTLPPLLTDPVRWNKLVIDKYQGGVVKMNDEIEYLKPEVDSLESRLSLVPYNGEGSYELDYTVQESNLTLTSNKGEKEIIIKLTRKDEKVFPLMNRKFNWINEYPYNR